MKKIVLLLIFCSSLLVSQELDKTGEGFREDIKIEMSSASEEKVDALQSFRGGIRIEMGGVYYYTSFDDKESWEGGMGISFPLRYIFNTQWATEINPGITFLPVTSGLNMGMRCYYFPFRNEYDKRNFLVFLGLDNAFCLNEKIGHKYNSSRSIVSLLFGTGIQRESSAFDLSVSIPFNHYTYDKKMHVWARFGVTWFFK